ncbi:MAG: hypothetical protein PVI06_13155 [Desulfobacterales bacterium]
MNAITKAFIMIICIVAVLSVTMAAAPQTSTDPANKTGEKVLGSKANSSMDSVGRVLLVFLVLSVVFEVALTPLFNWRIFMLHFEGKGYKTPITVVLAFIVFWSYGLDIIRDLLVALGQPANQSIGGQILTALLIAGGSSGVFQIFTKLKIRMGPDERKIKTDQARKDMDPKKPKAKTQG